jgi:anti-anti-sigma factor
MTSAGAAISLPGAAPPAAPTVIRLGALDFAAAPALRERLIGVLHRGASLLILDLSPVLSCDASGLAVLIATQRRARLLGIAMRLAAPSPPVARLLRSTGLARSFTIYPALPGALAAQPCELARTPPGPRLVSPARPSIPSPSESAPVATSAQ